MAIRGGRKAQDPDAKLREMAQKSARRRERRAVAEAARRGASKYNARPMRIDGHYFRSEAEGHRYRELSQLLAAGAIDNLRLQPSFDLTVAGVLIARYRADFAYDVIDDRGAVLRSVVEEVKGNQTAEYRLKAKLMAALHRDRPVAVLPSREVKAGAWQGRIP